MLKENFFFKSIAYIFLKKVTRLKVEIWLGVQLGNFGLKALLILKFCL